MSAGEPKTEEGAPGSPAPEPEERPPLGNGIERPAFVLHFPEDPELARLAAAFEAGNYALVRKEAEKLAKKTDRADVRDAALELRRRIDPDPLAMALLGMAALLLLALTIWAYRAQTR